MLLRPASNDWLAIAAAASLTAWVVVWLVRRFAPRLGLIDRPNHRSSHKQPTPRGGGVGIVFGAAVALLMASATGAAVTGAAWVVLGAASLVALVGLADDVRGLPPLVRFMAQTGAAIVVVAVTGPIATLPLPAPLNIELPVVAGWVGSILWITAVTNFFNFMDGIDGLAGGQALASVAGVAVAGWAADASWLAISVGAASLGFLIHNWAPARVFMGDVGSGFLGFLIAALPFLAPAGRQSDAIMAVAVGLALFLLDPVETLVRRGLARKPLAGAHREHVYQQFVGPGEPAGLVAAALTCTGLVLAVLGASAFRSQALGWVALSAAVLAYIVERSLALPGGRRI